MDIFSYGNNATIAHDYFIYRTHSLYILQHSLYILQHSSDQVVSQGTKLGAPLFLVMINDLKTRTPTPKYTDDTTLHGTRPAVGPGLLQTSLNMVAEWANDNDMSLNAI